MVNRLARVIAANLDKVRVTTPSTPNLDPLAASILLLGELHSNAPFINGICDALYVLHKQEHGMNLSGVVGATFVPQPLPIIPEHGRPFSSPLTALTLGLGAAGLGALWVLK